MRPCFPIVLLATLTAFASAQPKDWEPAIRKFEEKDKASPPPKEAVLFIGSSSIRGWNLKKSFPGTKTINRGFGGSELSDSIKYFDRLVTPWEPAIVLLYAGDNDISRGKTAEQVVADYKTFALLLHKKLPKAHFAFIPIKPSLKRWNLWPEMKKANAAIEKLTKGEPWLHYVDTASPMLKDDGMLKPELFVKDGLHLSEAGYALWNKQVQAFLDGVE